MTVQLDRFSEDYARSLDESDPLAGFRDAFYVEPETIYLDGNSLGLLSRPAEAALLRVLQEWRTLGVDGWLNGNPPWYLFAEGMAMQTAPLLGCNPDEIAIANSTTVNLHQLLATLFKPTGGRNVLLADTLNFPSDIYAIQSHLRTRGLDSDRHFRMVQSRDGLTLAEDDIIAEMRNDVALIVLPAVLYTSGQLLDMERLTKEARRRDIVIGFDCSHSIGAVHHKLTEWGVDFAFWCSYKYLNAGPGAIGGLYLNRRHFAGSPGMAGWFGNRKSSQFDMSREFDPAPDASKLQIGTPGILSLAPLQGSLEIVLEAGIDTIRAKSLAMTRYLLDLADQFLGELNVAVASPREDLRRGGHVALAHLEAVRICQALKAERVIPDFRPPDIIRLGPSPLYSRFVDCYNAIQTLARILQDRSYFNYPRERGLVA